MGTGHGGAGRPKPPQIAEKQSLTAQLAEARAAREQAERERDHAIAQRDELHRLLEDLPANVGAGKGPDLTYSYLNRQARRAFGQLDPIGKKPSELLPDIAAQGFLDHARALMANDESWVGREVKTLAPPAPDGTRAAYYFDLIYQPTHDAEGRVDGLLSFSYDVTAMVEARQKVEQSEHALRRLADAMPQIVWTTPVVGHPDFINRKWFDYTGADPEGGLEGDQLGPYLHPDEVEDIRASWATAMATGEPYASEYRLRGRDGLYRWHLGRAVPMRDAEGAIVGWVGTATDIHDQKELERRLQAQAEELQSQAEELIAQQEALASANQSLMEVNQRIEAEVAERTEELQGLNEELIVQSEELQAANHELHEQSEELEALDRYKDEFLSVISHELRTPLNFITGFASTLDDEVQGPLNAHQHDAVGKILNGSDRMLMLVDDLLDFAKIQSGRFELTSRPTAVGPLVEEVLGLLKPLADRKGLALSGAIDVPGAPALDGSRVGQVLTNLVSNAIKFTDAGCVSVRAFVRDGALRLEVRDTGIGIAPEDQSKLFNRFQQVDMSPTRRAGGTGLGLAISKALVEAHGGTIGVESAPGEGSTFWVSLPLA